jgi:hypothetical protein
MGQKSESASKTWKSEEVRQKRIAGLKKAWAQAKLEGSRTPHNKGKVGIYKNTKETLLKKKLSSEKTWSDPEKRQKRLDGQRRRSNQIFLEKEKLRLSIEPKFCKDGCGRITEWNERNKCYNDYCHGHNPGRKGNFKTPDIPLDLEVCCKRCGKRIEIRPRLKKIPEYCHGHNPNSGFEKRHTTGAKLSTEAYQHFIERQVNGYTNNCKTKQFYSKKNDRQIYYHSSYELAAFEILEQMSVVKSYDRVRYAIDYEYEGKTRKYIPDILITYQDGNQEIIEVKPEYQLKNPMNIAKLESLKKYCLEKDLKFGLWTEDQLGLAA